MADQEFHLGAAIVRIDRHHGDPERVERQPMNEKRWTVLQQQRDAVAVAVTARCVAPGKDGDAVRCRAVGQRGPSRHDQEGMIGRRARGVGKGVADGWAHVGADDAWGAGPPSRTGRRGG